MRNADWLGQRLFPSLGSSSYEKEVSSREVIDADEEIFLLYTLSAPESDRMGLGQVDNKSDTLQVTIDLVNSSTPLEICPVDRDEAGSSDRGNSHSTLATSKAKKALSRPKALRVIVRQNSTSLRSTGGDTGSVIWRSSLHLAEKIVRDLSDIDVGGRRRHANETAYYLIKPNELAHCQVLELGSGTGILPLLLLSHPYLAESGMRLKWLATDQTSMLPLLRKNLSSSSASVSALDWVEASTVYQSQSDSVRQVFYRNLMDPFSSSESPSQVTSIADLIIATDCVFNPYLFGPFVNTLNLCSTLNKTVVMVVSELREPDAMTEFLQIWLKVGQRGERWSIYALEGEAVLGKGLLRGSVVWVGWRLC